ncbi:MAG: hypothetical protein JO022_00540 [Acidobacteriaceae bacterium]|nr:hypothetical protein [Acidobacteriaceae bacterium]
MTETAAVLAAGTSETTTRGFVKLVWVLLAAAALGVASWQLGPVKEVCLVAAAVLALLTWILTMGTVWARAGSWLALAIAGQAAALQLIHAGVDIHFQHFIRLEELREPRNALLLGFLALQAVVTGYHLRPHVRAFTQKLRWSALLLLGPAALSAAFLSRDLVYYGFEIMLGLTLELVSAGTLALAALSVPARALEAVPARIRIWSRSQWLPVLAGVWITTVTAFLSFTAYGRHPHVPDEVSYLYQANYFAAGHLTVPALPASNALQLDLITYEPGRHYSPFPPGWPALLAVGVFAGAPWLVNPILAGLAALGLWLWVRGLYGRGIAGAVLGLLCCSPWYLFLGMSFMSHIAMVLFLIAGALCVERARISGRTWFAIAAGACFGYLSLIRPFDGVLLAAVLGIRLLTVRGARSKLKLAAGFALGCLVLGGLALPYNNYLTGHPLKFPVDDYFDRYYGPGVNSLGFGPNKGMSWPIDPFPGHGLRDVVANAALNLASTNVELLGWSTGAMLPLLLFFVFGRRSRRNWLMIGLALTVPAAYSFYWYSGGPDFGARYWFSILPAGLVFAVLGLRRLGARLGGAASCRVLVAAAALCLMTIVNYLPWRALDKYHGYLHMLPDLPQIAASHHFGKALVLIRGKQHPDFASAAVYNPLDLTAASPAAIFVWDRDEKTREEAIKAFPGRAVWIVDGPSITGRGYSIAAGPLSPSRTHLAGIPVAENRP